MRNAPVFSNRSERSSFLHNSEVLVRFALVPIAVAFCYCFRWELLRYLTSEANLRLDLLAGLHLQRLSLDTVQWRGSIYRYENACTFVDVWIGSMPLLWNLRRSVAANLGFFAQFAIALFVFNVFRLSLSDVLFSAGLNWDLAHNAVSGIAYFAVWVWFWRNRPFLTSPRWPVVCPVPTPRSTM
jgi:hypothetical protein